MNLEYAQQEIINVEQRWIKIQSETISNWQKDKARLKSKIDFFQSKLAALKHENNQLRRKIKPTP
jgi:predicted RNase H-like nuclease (RuvC/YqgF family)